MVLFVGFAKDSPVISNVQLRENMAVLTIEVLQLEHVINKVMSHYFIVLVLSLLFYL